MSATSKYVYKKISLFRSFMMWWWWLVLLFVRAELLTEVCIRYDGSGKPDDDDEFNMH